MKRIRFSSVYALLIASFTVAAVAQIWGDAHGALQKEIPYEKNSKNKAGESTTIPMNHGSCFALSGVSKSKDSNEFNYGHHKGRRDDYRGYFRSYHAKTRSYEEHHVSSPGNRDGHVLLTKYGKLKAAAWRGPNKVTVYDLMAQWERYDAYWAGLAVDNPSGVMFDPKGDDRKLVSDKWVAVKDQAELSTLVRWLDAGSFRPVLWRILDPDDQSYGYLYSPWDHVVLKVVDSQTLWVDDLPFPPIDQFHRRRHW